MQPHHVSRLTCGSCITTIRPAQPVRCCSRRRSAIRSTTTSIRWSCSDRHGRIGHSHEARRRGKTGRRQREPAHPIRPGSTAGFGRPHFHNQIGILTETIGSPTPVEIPFVPDMQLPRADVPNPIAPQTWHFRQSIGILADQ